MKQKEPMDKMKQLVIAISKTLTELEKGENLSFYKSLLQKQSIELYESAESFTAEGKGSTSANIKIIKQEDILEPVKTPEPVKVPEPVIEKVSLKPEIVVPPIPQPELIESAIAPPAVETTVINESSTMIQETIIEPTPVEPPALKDVKEISIPPIPKQVEAPEKTIKPVDTRNAEDLSLNEKLSLNKQPVINVAEKSKETPITDLAKAISISKKFEFIKGLFDGDGESYKAAISALQSSASYQDALNYINTNVRNRYDWSDNEDLSAELNGLLKRRFMN